MALRKLLNVEDLDRTRRGTLFGKSYGIDGSKGRRTTGLWWWSFRCTSYFK